MANAKTGPIEMVTFDKKRKPQISINDNCSFKK